MDGGAMQVDIQLLGPMCVRVDGQVVTPTAAKQRKILALLALNAGRVVNTTTLTEELWDAEPPATRTATLQTYILQLRKRLAGTPGSIATHHGGYLLCETACRTDITDFDCYALQGRAAAEARDYRAAADLLARSLSFWRGPALSDVPPGRVLGLEALALEERRLGILERRIEADLALSRHTDLLGELYSLTASHPIHENLAGYLMMALYRSGNSGRALAAYQRLRDTLHSDLGLDPSPRIQRLHHAILTHDPAIEATGTLGSARPRQAVLPEQARR